METVLKNYIDVDNHFNYLLEVKYKKNGRFMKMVYYDASIRDPEPHLRYILVDTNKYNYTFTTSIDCAIDFVGLDEDERKSLKSEIEDLSELGKYLRDRTPHAHFVFCKIMACINS